MRKACGLIPPMITVFDDNGVFDEKRTRDHVDYLIEGGVDGVAPMGSTGEFVGLSDDERKEVVESVIDAVDGRVKVYPGTAHYSTLKVIDHSLHAQKAGADGVMIVNPYYMVPPSERVLDHFRTIRDSIDVPIMLYQNPYFSGYELTIWDVAKLTNERVIQAVKLAHGAASQVHDLKLLVGDKLQILYGHDLEAPEALLAGADGWVTSLLNIIPSICKEMMLIGMAKETEKTFNIWYRILPLIQFLVYNPPGEREKHWLEVVKTALGLMGRDVGSPLPPLKLLDKEQTETLRRILQEVGIIVGKTS